MNAFSLSVQLELLKDTEKTKNGVNVLGKLFVVMFTVIILIYDLISSGRQEAERAEPS